VQKLYVASHVAPYMTKLHPDDREGILVRICDRPTETATQELLVVGTGPVVDFTQDLDLNDPPQPGRLQSQPTNVHFDAGGELNAMWISQGEDMVKIDNTSHAIRVANHLLAWAHAENKKGNGNE